MSVKIFTIIAVRILAIYIFLQSMSIFFPMVYTVFTNSDYGLFFNPVLYLALYAVALWFIAPKAAEWIAGKYALKETGEVKLKYHIESYIILTIGILLAAYSIPSIIGKIAFIYDAGSSYITGRIKASLISNAVSDTVKFIIGVVFILYSHKIGAYFKKKFDAKTD